MQHRRCLHKDCPRCLHGVVGVVFPSLISKLSRLCTKVLPAQGLIAVHKRYHVSAFCKQAWFLRPSACAAQLTLAQGLSTVTRRPDTSQMSCLGGGRCEPPMPWSVQLCITASGHAGMDVVKDGLYELLHRRGRLSKGMSLAH